MLTFTLGTFAIALNHLLLISALALATFVGWRVAKRGGENPESVLFGLFLLGLFAARISFVAAYWNHYRDDPWQIVDLRDGGFLAWPGIVALLVAAAVALGVMVLAWIITGERRWLRRAWLVFKYLHSKEGQTGEGKDHLLAAGWPGEPDPDPLWVKPHLARLR